MKYINFKRYKFSTVFKNLNTLVFKNLNTLKLYFFKILSFIRYSFKRKVKLPNVKDFDFNKKIKYFNPITYFVNQIKNINFSNSKFLLLHLPVAILFFTLLYLIIPSFYNYDKSEIVKEICNDKNIECLIKGKVKYKFYPTPRIKIENFEINNISKKKKNIITANQISAKLSFKNLLAKEKQKIKKIDLNNFEINFNLKNFKAFKNIFSQKIDSMPIFFNKGKILFFDEEDYVASFENVSLNMKVAQNFIEASLKGEFLDDDIYINLDSKKNDSVFSADLIFKMSKANILTKANIKNSSKDKNLIKGNALIKKNKNRITTIFDFKDNEFNISKSNIKNSFIDGQLMGKITLLPYFNFDLNIDLNSINFTRLYKNFLFLNANKQKEILKVNDKINGKLNLSSQKIYSSYNIIKSFESRLHLNNGDIVIDQLLLNLGKLGAADVLGSISHDEKLSSFKFESNIFVDNQKKFISKFGIYNRESIPSNLFISGNFDLNNLKFSFYEISDDEKLNSDDVNFIENEFNDLMLENDYKTLFHFPNFKKFIKSITSE
tara:strand:- start:510 stop:2156 length:1647 start_codon:yes stop_codon:yes gene_type:complete